MKPIKFWKIFWFVASGYLVLFTALVVGLKILYTNQPDDASLAAAIGLAYNASQDPFERPTTAENFGLFEDYLYRDSMPLGFEDWSWSVSTDWRSSELSYEGSYSLKTNFQIPWSGVRLSGPAVDVTQYKSISLAVYPDQFVDELYLELYDSYGQSYGIQSLGWYTDGSKLVPNKWNFVSIPLSNLISSIDATSTGVGKIVAKISGFSVSSKNPGTAYIDDVRLQKTVVTFPKWHEPEFQSHDNIADPFASSTQISLPYSFTFTPDKIETWHNFFGAFEKNDKGILFGPVVDKNTGSMAAFSGGRNWQNYKVETTVYWGLADTYSILLRFVNDGNFVACAYSYYGAFVQIYQMKNGVSTLVSQTPILSIRANEPWKDAKHSASVFGDTLTCYMDGGKVLTAKLPEMPNAGTVGLETWSPKSDDYPHTLESLQVTAYP